MKLIIPVLSLGLIAPCAGVAFAVPGDPDGPDRKPGPVAVTIRATSSEIEVGQRPTFRITLLNQGKEPVTLVQPGDGSESAWRTPVIGWSVLPAESKAAHPDEIPLHRGGRCGNINPLGEDEVIRIKGGDQTELGTWVGQPSFPKPGKYRVVFYYANRPKIEWHGLPLGSHHAEAMKAVRDSTACELRSNEIIISVRAAGDD